MNSRDPVIVATARTPIGRLGGVLASVRPDDLAALVMRAVLERAGLPAEDVTDVYFGCANGAGEDNRNVARMSALLAGLPVTVPGVTVNRLCGSGLEAVHQAAKAIIAGEGEVFLAGGVESMSRAPYAMAKPERGYATGNPAIFDTSLGWRFINPKLQALYGTEAMGETAENLAAEYSISRAAQDEYALESHRKALVAQDSGLLDAEIVSVEVTRGKSSERVTRDEAPRRETTLEALGQLRPVFREGGSVTAGNASSLNDGASALLLTSREYAATHGLDVLATVRSFATAGVPPRIMGIGPVPASFKAMARLGAEMTDLKGLELNEAFAAQVLAVLHDLGISPDDARLNPGGGSIALGHPLGCSGGRILGALVRDLRRNGGGLGLATMCIGVGQGIATVIEA